MKRETREKARDLRRQGMSVKEIAKALKVSRSSVSLWVRDVELTEQQKIDLKERQRHYAGQSAGGIANRKKFMRIRLQYQEAGRLKAREGSALHLAGCMLYWAEGAKSKNRLYFVNSDPNMLLLFQRFLKEELVVDDEIMRLYVHCHATDPDEIQRIETYWTNLLGLSASHLRKTQIKKGSEIRRTTLENGVCGIEVCKTELVQHIYGAIQEYGGFENPGWVF
jgi:transcriptional regulator with XRE-family HTH domain